MTRLPIFLLLSVICYLLSTTSSFAQEITPTISSSPQIYPAGTNPIADFINNLIPQTLNQVNCANLPLDACQGIKTVVPTKTSGIAPNSIQPQANDNTSTVYNATGQYTIASGVHTPPDVSQASTNIIDSIINFFKDLTKIFNKGEKEAKNYAGTVLPQDVNNQNFAGQPADNSFATEKSNVLGIEALGSAMDRSLPLVQCGGLPAELCTNNKPNIIQ